MFSTSFPFDTRTTYRFFILVVLFPRSHCPNENKHFLWTKTHINRYLQFHAIGFQGLVQSDTSKYVHHVRVRAYRDVDDCGQACDAVEDDGDETTFSSNSTSSSSSSCNYNFADVFLWTPGSTNSELPEDVGYKFSTATGNQGFSSISVQTHYNNPEEDVGVTDSSGVRVYYTEELREMDMGVIELGDPFVRLVGTPLPAGKSSFSFSCPGSCTGEHFEVCIGGDDGVVCF